ncbi:hypothetical protein T07_12743 [Trichinella nelsoni]|uniref:Uncharacterized protein n=1 Tax=Trichinella nelsoni TaxID=6336 RepID=A0A0V0RKK3_9BILA|nr:hypothetical protein T07_12743 [Trichinella nelsoni]
MQLESMSFAFVESYSLKFICAICHVDVINRTIACRTKSRQMLTDYIDLTEQRPQSRDLRWLKLEGLVRCNPDRSPTGYHLPPQGITVHST